jgi:hypothetical protein
MDLRSLADLFNRLPADGTPGKTQQASKAKAKKLRRD